MEKSKKSISTRDLFTYFLITFTISWGILALYIFASRGMTNVFGPLSGSHPLFFLATWSPAIAASIIILFKMGPQSLKRFFLRVLLWRASSKWYLFLLIGIPLIFYIGAAWKGTLFSSPFTFESINAIFITLTLAAFKGPIEEFGWRGFALPIFQRRVSPFWAAFIIGIIWGVWHLPAFLVSGTQQNSWSFLPFLFGTIMISIIITALSNESKGSILLAGIMHFQLMNPIWPDAQPYDSYLLGVMALIMVLQKKKKMFSMHDSEKRVV